VRPLRREQQHAELVHELGHVVQYANLPDGDPRWDAYRRLRSIQDEQRFGPASIHADRPHEIFAEDFRALFGGAAATYSGTIENDTLTPPAQIAGLDAFMIALAGPGPDQAFSAWPNPSSGMLHFSWEGGAAVPLDVFDAAGRRVATIAPETRWGSIAWSLDAAGLAQTTGGAVVYARPRGARGLGVRVVLMPRR
jgi:hypothetical protein